MAHAAMAGERSEPLTTLNIKKSAYVLRSLRLRCNFPAGECSVSLVNATTTKSPHTFSHLYFDVKTCGGCVVVVSRKAKYIDFAICISWFLLVCLFMIILFIIILSFPSP